MVTSLCLWATSPCYVNSLSMCPRHSKVPKYLLNSVAHEIELGGVEVATCPVQADWGWDSCNWSFKVESEISVLCTWY